MAGVLIVMYLFNVVAVLAPRLRGARDVSYFHYFNLKGLIGTGTYPLADSLMFVAIGLGSWAWRSSRSGVATWPPISGRHGADMTPSPRPMLAFEPFTEEHVDDAARLVTAGVSRLRASRPALPAR